MNSKFNLFVAALVQLFAAFWLGTVQSVRLLGFPLVFNLTAS